MLQESDVQLGARMSGPTIPDRDLDFETQFGAEIDDLGGKLDGFCGWKVGKLGEKLDLLKTQRIHGSKSKKHHQTNKSQKILGAIFWWGFSNLGQNQQN